MAGRVEHLVPLHGAMLEGEHEVFGSEHPMRRVTRDVAFGGEWTAEMSSFVAGIFDSMADEWNALRTGDRYDMLDDAFERGGPLQGRCVELGSGTGLGTARLADRFGSIVAVDLSAEMLRNAPAELAHRVRADASELPIRAGSVEVLVLVNMLLFPAEVDRVLATEGSLVWVNTYAEETPIHLPADDVVGALPGTWTASASRAGSGTWCVARRE